VNRVAGKGDWLDTALDLARMVAQRAPLASRLAKQAVLTADETPLTSGLAEERRLYRQAMATEDRVEAMQAYREQRAPRFSGR
jgi:enoyl-CoA hydratase